MAAIDGNGPGDDERWLYGDEPEEEQMPTPETVSREAEIPASVVEASHVNKERELKTSNVESGGSVSEPSKSDGILDRPPGVDDENIPLPDDDKYEGEANENLDADDKDGDEPFDDGDKEPFDEPLDDGTKKDAGKDEDGDSDSSDDNVSITIGEASKAAAAAPAYGGYGFGKRVGFGAHLAIGKAANAIPLGEIEGSGTISGKPAHEFSLDSVEDYPWRKPGADITDYFNYGFNEETWRAYCDRQRRMRLESGVITYKQGQSLHANALQPNLNPQPRYREFYRDRDAAAPSTNGMPAIPMPPRPIPATSPMTFSMSAAMPGPPPKKTIDVIGGSSGTSRRSLEIDETKAIQVMSGSVLKVAHYPKEEGKFETDDFNMVDLSMPPPDMSRPPPVFPSGQPHVTVLPPRLPMDFDFPPMRPPPGAMGMDPYGDMYALENDPYYRSYEPPGLPPPLSEMKSLPDWMPPPAGLPPPMGVPPPLPPGMMQPPAPRAPVAGLGPPPPPSSSLSSRFSSGNDGGPPPCPPGEDSLPAPPAVSVKREPRPNDGDDGGRSSSGSDSDDVEAGAGGVRPAVDRDVPAVTVIPQSSSSHSARRRSASRREDKDRRHSSRRRSRSRSPSASSAGEESLSHRRDRERDRDRDRDRDQDRDKEREGDRDRDRHRDRERERDRDRRDRDKDKDKERDRDRERERERERDRDSRHRSSRKRARHHSSSPTSD